MIGSLSRDHTTVGNGAPSIEAASVYALSVRTLSLWGPWVTEGVSGEGERAGKTEGERAGKREGGKESGREGRREGGGERGREEGKEGEWEWEESVSEGEIVGGGESGRG